MTSPNARSSLDAWFADVEDVTTEVAKLHDAGLHDWCDSLPRRRSQHLVRRLELFFSELGLDEVVPSQWVTATKQGLAFDHLPLRSADKLLLALEDLARRG
jgi:hypothetical protein